MVKVLLSLIFVVLVIVPLKAQWVSFTGKFWNKMIAENLLIHRIHIIKAIEMQWCIYSSGSGET